jgi:hypothetical protein
MPFSFWEYNQYQKNYTQIIIGSGIVGLSTAIELSKLQLGLNVVVIDLFHPALGASTKNAGFACFGSVTELNDDLEYMAENEVVDIVKMRWNGIKILNDRLYQEGVNISFDGGKELFRKGKVPNSSSISRANRIMEKATGIAGYFKYGENTSFDSLDNISIDMVHEGELNPMDMYLALRKICERVGVQFIYGRNIMLDEKERKISLDGGIQLNFEKLFICTNGFTNRILPHIDVKPARNHVLVTEPIPNLDWKGVYHYDKGYYYFRRIGDRLLLGGARNFDPLTEETSSFDFNPKILDELKRFLSAVLLNGRSVKVEYTWTGILGVSQSKFPILDEYEKDCYLAVRLGGMGVAIGSYLGREVVKLAY